MFYLKKDTFKISSKKRSNLYQKRKKEQNLRVQNLWTQILFFELNKCSCLGKPTAA